MRVRVLSPGSLRLTFASVFVFGIIFGFAVGVTAQIASVDPAVFAYGFILGLTLHAATGWLVRWTWRRH